MGISCQSFRGRRKGYEHVLPKGGAFIIGGKTVGVTGYFSGFRRWAGAHVWGGPIGAATPHRTKGSRTAAEIDLERGTTKGTKERAKR